MFKYISADEKKWAIFESDNATLIKSKNIVKLIMCIHRYYLTK